MKLVILITEPQDYSPKALAIYKKLGRVYFGLNSLKKRNRLLKNVNILVVRLGKRIDRVVIDLMPNLKLIATPTTGLNHIDTVYAKKKGIKIISLRGQFGFLKNITSTAELTLGLIISLTRNIPTAFDSVKFGRWDRMSWRGHQLTGKVLGIVGLGRLGKIMAGYGRALGLKIIAYDPLVSSKVIRRWDARPVGLKELFKSSDIVSVHALLTDKNQEFIKFDHFKLMKPTAYFINTARAELIERRALHKALSKKLIAGAAIDVMDNESSNGSHLKTDHLWQYVKTHNNLIISPHMGGATFEAMHITEEFVAQLVKRYVKSKKLL